MNMNDYINDMRPSMYTEAGNEAVRKACRKAWAAFEKDGTAVTYNHKTLGDLMRPFVAKVAKLLRTGC